MRKFTRHDVDDRGMPRISCLKDDLMIHELNWMKLGLTQTATGYGARLVSRYMIHYEGRLRRIYITCYSNAGSSWFKTGGVKIHVDAH